MYFKHCPCDDDVDQCPPQHCVPDEVCAPFGRFLFFLALCHSCGVVSPPDFLEPASQAKPAGDIPYVFGVIYPMCLPLWSGFSCRLTAAVCAFRGFVDWLTPAHAMADQAFGNLDALKKLRRETRRIYKGLDFYFGIAVGGKTYIETMLEKEPDRAVLEQQLSKFGTTLMDSMLNHGAILSQEFRARWVKHIVPEIDDAAAGHIGRDGCAYRRMTEDDRALPYCSGLEFRAFHAIEYCTACKLRVTDADALRFLRDDAYLCFSYYATLVEDD